MDKYKVFLLPHASRDIDEIYSYISKNLVEPDTALKMVDRIENAIFSLEEMPARGSLRNHGVYASKGYRQLFVKNFTIIYRIDEQKKQVIIVTVRYSRSNF